MCNIRSSYLDLFFISIAIVNSSSTAAPSNSARTSPSPSSPPPTASSARLESRDQKIMSLFRMSREIKTVTDAWKQYDCGLENEGPNHVCYKLGIREVEENPNTAYKWRSSSKEEGYFKRRKPLFAAVEAMINNGSSLTATQITQRLEWYRVKKTLSLRALCKLLKTLGGKVSSLQPSTPNNGVGWNGWAYVLNGDIPVEIIYYHQGGSTAWLDKSSSYINDFFNRLNGSGWWQIVQKYYNLGYTNLSSRQRVGNVRFDHSDYFDCHWLNDIKKCSKVSSLDIQNVSLVIQGTLQARPNLALDLIMPFTLWCWRHRLMKHLMVKTHWEATTAHITVLIKRHPTWTEPTICGSSTPLFVFQMVVAVAYSILKLQGQTFGAGSQM